MKWLKYAIAATALAVLWSALNRRRPAAPHSAAPDPASASASPVEQEMENQAMARAHSEVASGEYDMQG